MIQTKEFQSLTDIEHVLKRPEVYGGQIGKEEKNFVINGEIEIFEISPMLYKMVDEAIVNAVDNFTRGNQTTKICVDMDKNGLIYIKNNGKGVPVEIHENGQWTPEMVFFHLRSGQNFEDGQGREVGGKNGYGIKLAAIFSTSFTLETVDKARKLKYKQTYTDNMKKAGKRKVSKSTLNDYTKLKFQVDMERFGIKELPDSMFKIIHRRLQDVASLGIKTKFNGEVIPIKNFTQYAAQINPIAIMETAKWKCAIGIGEGNLCFMNNVYNADDGTQLHLFTDKVYEKLIKKNEFKKKNIPKYKLFGELKCIVFTSQADPTFNSQMKDRCTLYRYKYSNPLTIPDSFVNKLMKHPDFLSLIEKIYEKTQSRLDRSAQGKLTRFINVSKCVDAIKAGTKESDKCTLILTEGDSALRLAQAGLSVISNQYYGCYPLKGKILNGFKCSKEDWRKNTQIKDIIQILGLRPDTKDTSKLRYKHVLIMADQDTDGFHIRGLVMALFGSHYPDLMSVNGFIQIMKTPLIKAFRGKTEIAEFFNQESCDHYMKENPSLTYKYYKGLGTSTAAEAKVYFQNLKRYVFNMTGPHGIICQAFGDTTEDKIFRKELSKQQPLKGDGKTYDEFIKGPFNDFVHDSNIRAIPSIVDGMKPSQRKVLWTCIKKVSKEIRISSLAGLVTQFTHYHHGEASICQTAIKMAQDFMGSNNINLLQPNGQFGTRHSNGKDAAAPRYIYTKCMPIVPLLFPPGDYPVYNMNKSDGQIAEPESMVPIIPMLLVNGGMGLGTGWSCNIPSHNIRNVINNTKSYIQDQEFVEMPVYVKDFKGHITDKYHGKYVNNIGRMVGLTCDIKVLELPPGVETHKFKEKLLKLNAKVNENHTDKKICFEITGVDEEKIKKLLSVPIKNVWYAYDHAVIPVNQQKIFEKHGEERVKLYEKRKQYQLKQWDDEIEVLQKKIRFIQDVNNNKINLRDPQVENKMLELGHNILLLDMSIRKLGEENNLKQKIKELDLKISNLYNTSVKQLWLGELEKLEQFLYGRKRTIHEI